jgi:hypothetical protein
VNLTVASGKVALVNLVGYTVDAATRDLTSADLNHRERRRGPSCPPWARRRSSPDSHCPGRCADPPTVELRVCTGSDPPGALAAACAQQHDNPLVRTDSGWNCTPRAAGHGGRVP